MMHLKIENPCSENWNKMKPNNTGRHCSSCEKTVIDFRAKSKLEIQSLVDTSDSVCAIVNKHQLYSFQYVRPIKRLAFALLIVFGNALFSISASAQEITQKLKETYLKNDSTKSITTLTGTVINDNGEPMPFANVILFFNDDVITGTSTDFDGNYKIELDKSYINKEFKLEVDFVGYDKRVKKITIQKGTIKNDFIIKFNKINFMIGMIYTPTIISRDPSDANKTTFSKEEIQRSPNQ